MAEHEHEAYGLLPRIDDPTDTQKHIYGHTNGGSWTFLNCAKAVKPCGGSKAHNNMEPYTVVYIFKRTA